MNHHEANKTNNISNSQKEKSAKIEHMKNIASMT